MDWSATLDAYCERLNPGLWAEPFNALSNLAFWLAAWLVWLAWRQRRAADSASGGTPQRDIDALLLMLAAIGAGSLAFHTLATAWARALDVLFIALYLHFYLAVYARRALGLRWRWAWIGMPAFTLLSLGLAPLWRGLAELSGVALSGAALSGAALQADADAASRYAAAWTVLLLLLAHSAFRRLPSAKPLAAAAVCFAPSLVLRQLDLPLCEVWPLGTHFAWHLLNAATLGLTSLAILRLADSAAGAQEAAGADGAERAAVVNADSRKTGSSSRSR